MIVFENVGLRYGMGPEVLKDISLQIPRGAFTFLSGPSGAGKTSLLRLMFFALRPTRGLISILGRQTSLLPRSTLLKLRRRIGVVFQDFLLLDHLTVFQNVALPLIVENIRISQYENEVYELLEWVGLLPFAHQYPAILSGGEKQRAAIARAVIRKPDILLADEPTGNVDSAMALRLLKLFQELNALGTTVLIATHDHVLLSSFKAPVFTLDRGRLFEDCPISASF